MQEQKTPEQKPQNGPDLAALMARIEAAEARAIAAEARAAKAEAVGAVAPPLSLRAAPYKMQGPAVKIQAKEEIFIPGRDEVVRVGEIIEVDEPTAKLLCKVHEGHFKFSGVRPNAEIERHKYQKAVRVA